MSGCTTVAPEPLNPLPAQVIGPVNTQCCQLLHWFLLHVVVPETLAKVKHFAHLAPEIHQNPDQAAVRLAKDFLSMTTADTQYSAAQWSESKRGVNAKQLSLNKGVASISWESIG